MATRLEAESTLTERYQTTIPSSVRRILKLTKSDKIRFEVEDRAEGTVVILSRAHKKEEEDPVLGKFLYFLARDIEQHPERLVSATPTHAHRISGLVEGLDVDLDEPLKSEDE